MMKLFFRGLILFFGLMLAWQAVVSVFHLPSFILPTPMEVAESIVVNFSLLLLEFKITFTETLIGLVLGVLFGGMAALMMAMFKPVKFWLLPLLLISQALPTFAIAPLLVIWFGYGMASKIVTTMIMLFFPITTSLYDGLRRTPRVWLDLGRTMQASGWKLFWVIRIPAALPSFASGLRVATAIAPIGAVIGEWVGASQGLGFLMLNANARMQIDLMFAALFFIVVFSLSLYFVMDRLLRRLVFWKESTI